jgi:hypothetical protein
MNFLKDMKANFDIGTLETGFFLSFRVSFALIIPLIIPLRIKSQSLLFLTEFIGVPIERTSDKICLSSV